MPIWADWSQPPQVQHDWTLSVHILPDRVTKEFEFLESEALHGTATHADQLGWVEGSIDRHIWQSHGVFGSGRTW